MKTALLSQPALLVDKASLFRVDGQNYVSQTAQKEKHLLATVDIRTTLLAWIAAHPAFAAHAAKVKHSLADVYFDLTYHFQHHNNLRAAWCPLFTAFARYPQWRCFRLAARLLLPQTKTPKAD